MSYRPSPLLRLGARWMLVTAVLVAGLVASVAHAAQPPGSDRAPVVVGVRDRGSMASVEARIEAMGGRIAKRYGWGGYLVTPPEGEDRGRFKERAKGIPGVKYALNEAFLYAQWTPSPLAPLGTRGTALSTALIPNDPDYPDQWGLPKIGAPAAWDVALGDGIAVAIVDSGVDYTHPDLIGAVTLGPDFVDSDNDPMDVHGHGTMMAGIAGANTDNGLFGAGTAPLAPLVAVRVLDAGGTGSAAEVADGVNWCADNGIDVISLSLAGPETIDMQPLIDAVAYARTKGCLVVAASGNVRTGITDTTRLYPAACDGVVGVGATTSTDGIYVNEVHGTREDGTPVVTVVAPGVSIYVITRGGGTSIVSGTSCSTANVSGAAAVVWSAHPTYTADEIASLLTSTALDLAAPGRDVEAGWGRIQMDRAVGSLVPRAPEGLTAAWSPPGLSAGLTWTDNATDEDGFVVERAQNSTAPGSFSFVATVTADATSYTDSAGLDWDSTWYYRVRAFNAAGSSAYSNVAGVRLRPTVLVYRFYNRATGTHFYTADESEKRRLISALAWLYSYDGPAYLGCGADVGGAVPLHRFYNTRTGTHFYTADDAERARVIATLSAVYSYEGVAYFVLPVPSASTGTVYRFYNRSNGVHFYTASEAEKADVIARLSWLYTYEGAAFHVPR